MIDLVADVAELKATVTSTFTESREEEAKPHATQLTDFTAIVVDVVDLEAMILKYQAEIVNKLNMLITVRQ